MTTPLTNTARTILRSRLRRHPEIDKHLAPTDSVASLTNADLVQTARLLGIALPSPVEIEAYQTARSNGMSGSLAIDEADAVAPSLTVAPITASTFAMVADELVESDEKEEAPLDAATPVATTPAEDASDADATAYKAEAAKLVDETMTLLGKGDFTGFKARFLDVAERACKPVPPPIVQQVVNYDTSHLSGHVAKVTGQMNAAQAGIGSGGFGVKKTATTLDVYDAPDAPAVDPNYIWPDASATIISQLRRGRTVFLYGPAGTGKTSLAKQVAAHWKRPFVRISCDDQTEAATLTGMTVPDGAGGVKWQDGQLTAAIRRPGTVILVDEPSVARPGALFVLQAVLDDDRRLHVAETGEVVPVAPGVIIILADNTNGTGDTTGAYEATRRLNRAFLDRAGVTVRLDYLPPDAEADAVVKRTGCQPKHAAALSKFAALTRRHADDGKVSHGVGIRRLISLAELIQDGVDPMRAFQMSVLETAPFDDREPLRQMWTAEIGANTFKAA